MKEAEAAEKKAKEHSEAMLAAKNTRAKESTDAKKHAAKVAKTHAAHVKKAEDDAAKDAAIWKKKV